MMSDGTHRLLLAILSRALRDLRNSNQLIRAEALQWLVNDLLCAEICETLGYSLSALHQAVGLCTPVHQ
jgi:hypothetical protein